MILWSSALGLDGLGYDTNDGCFFWGDAMLVFQQIGFSNGLDVPTDGHQLW